MSGQGCLILRPFGGFKSAAQGVSGEESEGREREGDKEEHREKGDKEEKEKIGDTQLLLFPRPS